MTTAGIGAAVTRDDRSTYTVVEAAHVLGIGRGLAYEMVRQGRLPSLRLGRRIVIPARSLDALLAAETAAAGKPVSPPPYGPLPPI